MFGLAAGIYQSYFSSPQINILLIGVPGSGKTTLLERVKVTQFSKRPTTTTSTRTSTSSATSTTTTTISAASNRRAFSCPAPRKYQKETMEQQQHDDDDDDDQDKNDDDNGDNDNQNHHHHHHDPRHRSKWLHEKQQSSLDDIPVEDSSPPPPQQQKNQSPPVHHHHHHHHHPTKDLVQFHLKPGARMLPLEKIRPTIGMNLAKVEMCGAKCQVWDLGGKLQDLWERYYSDCDAVVYCVRLDPEEEHPTLQQQQQQQLTRLSHQQMVLEQVRLKIPDDIPFLVFGHVMDPTTITESSSSPPTLEQLLPHYHNNLMQYFVGSATTGEGVREAFEWLIPLAKRQLLLRQQDPTTTPTRST